MFFCDTCIGGSTVAARVADDRAGARACYLADYAVNPLGVKSDDEVRAALLRWLDLAGTSAEVVVVACNTASARLESCPEALARADAMGLQLFSMLDLLDEVLRGDTGAVDGARVCLMGTRFTVEAGPHRERLLRAGAERVVPLAATVTERTIAHLHHTTPQGRAMITDEIAATVRDVDVVALACTCFPLIADLIDELAPDCRVLDPSLGVSALPALGSGSGENHLTLVSSGNGPATDELRARAPELFPGWTLASVERLA